MSRKTSHSGKKHGFWSNLGWGLYNLLIVALCGVLLYAGYRVAGNLISAYRERQEWVQLREIKANAIASKPGADPEATPDPNLAAAAEAAGLPTPDPDTTPDPENTPIPRDTSAPKPTLKPDATILPEYQELYEMNNDLFGWLKCDAIGLDYPVMYTPDTPEFYINRGFTLNWTNAGTPFVDAECPPEGNYYLIYGHHVGDGTIFGQMEKFLDQKFCEENPIILFDTLYEHREYEVMSVMLTQIYEESVTGVFKYYKYKDLTEEKVFNEYVKQVLAASKVNTGVTAEYGDELITLSTCYWNHLEGRLVVVAKRIK